MSMRLFRHQRIYRSDGGATAEKSPPYCSLSWWILHIYQAFFSSSLNGIINFRWKIFIAIAVLALAGACGYVVYAQILSFEYILYNASYDATTLQIHTSLNDGLSYNYLATQDLAYAMGILCPFLSIWPNCM